jgi:hypothetical protein
MRIIILLDHFGLFIDNWLFILEVGLFIVFQYLVQFMKI